MSESIGTEIADAGRDYRPEGEEPNLDAQRKKVVVAGAALLAKVRKAGGCGACWLLQFLKAEVTRQADVTRTHCR